MINAWNNLGTAYYDLQRLNEAIECFKKALEINAKNNIVKNNLRQAKEKYQEKTNK